MKPITLLDCTLRDGGYYNSWDFSDSLIEEYLQAMVSIGVDYVELGLRTFNRDRFFGGCAYTTDSFLDSLRIPSGLKLGVMINASDFVSDIEKIESRLEQLFNHADDSPLSLVRIACHVHEFEKALPAAAWLKGQGYMVGFNLMQVADRPLDELSRLARAASQFPIDVLYFADSMGSMNPTKIHEVVKAFKVGWGGQLGIHTHDNMGQALANTIAAVESGVDWVDGTVTGMGRGPGNVKTEYLVLALEAHRSRNCNITPLLTLIREHFQPMQVKHGWGSNPYYYLAGKYGIHPSYIQEMLADTRYNEEDILAVIDHLKTEGGKKFSLSTLEAARHFFRGEPRGNWNPTPMLEGKDILILGAGPGVCTHRTAIETFIRTQKPFVIALNTEKSISDELIDIRAACHPVRLLADCEEHARLPQPLAIPASMLPDDVRLALGDKEVLDFGLHVVPEKFVFHENYAQVPTSLVIAYALAIATSGQGKSIYLAGFDGYSSDDPRRQESDKIFQEYQKAEKALPLIAITPTLYEIKCCSVYALNS
ncbi:aldolase catalytic domain-containing protein [Pseudomonas sp. NPDC089743]|uniref:aldolase catalytic domain-containing protein n=1 Tax=Pseudomonas sp. NPDC089743 TaxID=3364471 RepID=UPI003825240C